METLVAQDDSIVLADAVDLEVRSRQLRGLARAFLDAVIPTDRPGTQDYRDARQAVSRGQGTPEQRDIVCYTEVCIGILQGSSIGSLAVASSQEI